MPLDRQRRFDRRIGIPALILLYGVTWIGGCSDHSAQLRQEATRRYESASERTRELDVIADQLGVPFDPIELLRDGPKSRVNWAVPILPGLLLADSEFVVGPLYAKGSAKLVVYYGFGSLTLVELWGWMS
jgi:hypothetical protein